MNSPKFIKNNNYTREEIWSAAGMSGKQEFNFARTGYGRIGDNVFAFINIGFKGHAEKIFENKFDEETETLIWYGKKESHSQQPQIRNIIEGEFNLYCFARWDNAPEFRYLGIGKVLDYKDGATVIDKDGKETTCIRFRLACDDKTNTTSFVNDFDEGFEDELPPEGTEGRKKIVKHKKIERDTKIVRKKKASFLKSHGKLFCEVCGFDFKDTYGTRGDGFIECHHTVPLHETEKEITTKLDDLALLCSNCHRMIHRKKKWLTLDELSNLIKKVVA